ncbi:hypothetical protein CEF21_20670 [Bacillus sp. FJAT-42376]|nr:hypothetical protein CEF21_20670 [Bacillus sp. FJAT-42376]
MSDHFQDHGPFIEVKTKLFLIIWGLLATIGTFLVSLFLFYQGLKFESSYALIYLAVNAFWFDHLFVGNSGFFQQKESYSFD